MWSTKRRKASWPPMPSGVTVVPMRAGQLVGRLGGVQRRRVHADAVEGVGDDLVGQVVGGLVVDVQARHSGAVRPRPPRRAGDGEQVAVVAGRCGGGGEQRPGGPTPQRPAVVAPPQAPRVEAVAHDEAVEQAR